MRRWTAGLAAALLVATVCGPAVAQEPSFQRLPANHWAYTAVRALERSGFGSGSQEGTFEGKRKLTRYEFAMAIDRMYRGLQPRVLAATEAGSLAVDLRRFRRLIAEFREDLGELGPDVAEMQRQLDALDERVARLPRASGARPTIFEQSQNFGVRAALESPLILDGLSLLQSSPDARASTFDLQPGLTANLGPASAALLVSQPGIRPAEPRQPFQDPSSLLGYQARLSVPFGLARLSAFYNREGALADRYRLQNPYFDLGAVEGFGGAVTGSSGRLGVEVRAARLQTVVDDLAEIKRLEGALNYEVGAGFSLGVGMERTWLGVPGGVADYSAYTAAVGRRFGKNAQLELRWRYFMPGRGLAGGGERDAGNSSAVGQISVRF